jgi:NTE family protein
VSHKHEPLPLQNVGLVLPGGGARAAYQVGVLRAIADLLPTRAVNPFPVITGTSAGAVNATAIAIHADRFRVAVGILERVWRNFEVSQVFRADTRSMVRSGLHWLLAGVSGGWLLPPPKSLFDNTPLRELLNRHFDFEGIRESVRTKHLRALAIAAAGYSTARSVSFYEGSEECAAWARVRRCGEPTRLTIDHLMASVAVPFLFPPVLMGAEYYGDGSMRQSTPFSAAIHLGAERLLIVGTRNEAAVTESVTPIAPTFGQIFGYMLDALFTDGLYSDLERLQQINHIVGKGVADGPAAFKPIEMLLILPSEDLSEIARRHVGSLPRSLRTLLRSMGALNYDGGQLMSYIMFQSTFTRELIALGYRDAMSRSHDIISFLGGSPVERTGATQMFRVLVSGQEKRPQTQ